MTMITEQTESRILEIVRERGSIVLEELLSCLPESTWNQVFTSVDGLSRQGAIRLRRRRFDYELFASSSSPEGVCEAAAPASGLRPAAI